MQIPSVKTQQHARQIPAQAEHRDQQPIEVQGGDDNKVRNFGSSQTVKQRPVPILAYSLPRLARSLAAVTQLNYLRLAAARRRGFCGLSGPTCSATPVNSNKKRLGCVSRGLPHFIRVNAIESDKRSCARVTPT